jgi:nucleoside-diphosphate-sugar epimerase
VQQFGPWEEIHRINVEATGNLINAARQAGVAALVHVSSEAVLVGQRLIDVDETLPYAAVTDGDYPRSKRLAEELVMAEAAQHPQPRLVIVRPRFIWGYPDPTILPAFVHTVREGSFKWFDGGRYLTSTCHVLNCVEGMIRAAERGRSGDIYFLTDGQPVVFREFVSAMLTTQGVDPAPIGDAPLWAVKMFAAGSTFFHRLLPFLGQPSIVPATVKIIGEQVTLNDNKARTQLGYTSHVQREAGLQELSHPPSAEPASSSST